MEARLEQIAALREQCAEGSAAVFDAREVGPHAKAHVRRLGRNVEAVQELGEERVVVLVVHDEAGVDGPALSVGALHLHCVHMAADAIPCFEHREVVLWVKEVRSHESRDSTADDGYTHGCLLQRGRWRLRSL